MAANVCAINFGCVNPDARRAVRAARLVSSNERDAMTTYEQTMAEIQDCKRLVGEIIADRDRLMAENAQLKEMMEDAIPYIEESEQFNKPTARGLSKRFRAALTHPQS
jgi:hypothetical protein